MSEISARHCSTGYLHDGMPANSFSGSTTPAAPAASQSKRLRAEASQSDPVLVRADGSYLYSFTSVVDDMDFGITHVIRREDHVTNTGAQTQVFEALGAPVPTFAHLPLLVDAAGAA